MEAQAEAAQISQGQDQSDRKSNVAVHSRIDQGIVHTFSREEAEAFTGHINTLLRGDLDLATILPMKPDQLFDRVSESVLLW